MKQLEESKEEVGRLKKEASSKTRALSRLEDTHNIMMSSNKVHKYFINIKTITILSIYNSDQCNQSAGSLHVSP